MIFGMILRLAGFMPDVVVMGIFGDLKDAIVGAFEELGEKIANAMTDWAIWGIETSIMLLAGEVLPKPKVFLEGPVAIIFGANFGLALMILRGLVVIAILVTAIAAFRQRRTEFAGNVLTSIMRLFLFAILFFPVYTLLLSSLREVAKAVLTEASKVSGSSVDGLTGELTDLLAPNNWALQFLTGVVNGFLATSLLGQLGGIVVVGVLLSIFYPLTIVIRPFGKLGLNLFRYATAAVITIPVALLIMMVLLAMELVLILGANTVVPFLSGFIGLVLSFVFGLLIVLTPFIVFSLSYNKVEEIVGNTDAKIQSGIDVLTMPDINSRQIREDSNRDRLQYVRQFATELPGAIASGENSATTEAKELAKQIGLKAVATSTNPYIAAAGAAYTGVKVIQKLSQPKDTDGGDHQ